MNPQGAQKKTVVTAEGTTNELDLSGMPDGEVFIYLGKCPYLWQGEERIEFHNRDGLHMVNGAVYGADLDRSDVETIEKPDDILAIRVSGENLEHVSRFPNLLALSAHDLDSGDGRHLGSLTGLRIVDLGLNENVGDDDLAHISGLSDLRWLNLLKTAVTDAGLAHLQGLAMLSILWLADTPVAGYGLRYLAGLTRLGQLGLSRTSVSDKDLIHLAELKNLRILDLAGTAVTDGAVEHLACLARLEGLNLESTEVSSAGVAELSRRLPGCTVDHSTG